MLHILKRHPIPMAGRVEQAVSLTYAFPAEILLPMVSPGLNLDVIEDTGFLAVTTVQTCDLRPAFLPPAFGRDYFLTSYRLFTRLTTRAGGEFRGLQTLRSDTNDSRLVKWGTRLTRYEYRQAEIEFRKQDGVLQLDVNTPHQEANLRLSAEIPSLSGGLPAGSPFTAIETAHQFVAPLSHTFDYEPETGSIIVVEGRRTNWNPQPIDVPVQTINFFQSSAFRGSQAVLAAAFYVMDVPYRWRRGRRYDVRRGQ